MEIELFEGFAVSSSMTANVERFAGFAPVYDAYRPSPPTALAEVLTQLAGMDRAGRVTDVGCGTGLSTRIWAGRAREVVGIEPNGQMRRQAELGTEAAEISYREGLSTQTGLSDGWADIITCCQCLHWMEPEGTFAEFARVLRPGGVFAACDVDYPPVIRWEAEEAYRAFHGRVTQMERDLGSAQGVRRWDKSGHLERMNACGRFRWTKEILLHKVEMGDADRLVGLSLSFGTVPSLKRHGVTEEQMGVEELRAAARRILGDEPMPWYFSFRVRVGMK